MLGWMGDVFIDLHSVEGFLFTVHYSLTSNISGRGQNEASTTGRPFPLLVER